MHATCPALLSCLACLSPIGPIPLCPTPKYLQLDQVMHPYTNTGKIVVLHNLIFIFRQHTLNLWAVSIVHYSRNFLMNIVTVYLYYSQLKRICRPNLYCHLLLCCGSEISMCFIFCILPSQIFSLLFSFQPCDSSLVLSVVCVAELQVLRGCCRFDGWHQKAWRMACSQATLMSGAMVWYYGRWPLWRLSPIRWLSLCSLCLLMHASWMGQYLLDIVCR